MSTSDLLDAKIRALVLELVESAPLAPAPSTFASNHQGRDRTRSEVAQAHTRLGRRRLVYLVPLACAAAAIALVVGVVLPSGTGGPSSAAAAAELHNLAKVAASRPTPVLKPGQYYKQVWEERAQMSPFSSPRGSLPLPGTPNVFYLGMARLITWVDATGTGRCTFGQTGSSFLLPKDEETWKTEGQPPLGISAVSIGGDDVIPPIIEGSNGLFACPQSASSTNAEIGTSGTWEENGSPLQLFDVSGLPTHAAALRSLIAHRYTGIGDIDSEASGEFNTFAAVVQLLSGPDVGATSAFRSALYQVLAGLPGVKVSDSVTDAHGRSGVEISLPISYPFSHLTGSFVVTGSFVEKAIVDPRTTDLLDWSVDALGPTRHADATFSAEGWSMTYEPGTVYSFALLSSKVVASDSVTASNVGDPDITASG